MHKYKFLLFDLDGTLTDSGPGIMNAASIALSHYNIEEADPERLRMFVGPPLDKSFMERYGFSKEKAWEAVNIFREYYTRQGVYENSVYPGMEDLLTDLRKEGFVVAIASSKPIVQIERVLKHFNLGPYFDVVVGCELDGTRSSKSEVIEEVIRQLTEIGLSKGIPADQIKEQSIMIGDRFYDVDGAHAFGLPCIGVLYGYGSRKEFEDAGADFICETVEDLRKFFLQ